MRVAAEPDLYDPAPDQPALRGTRCETCGRVSFPPMSIGCDACGTPDERLEAIEIPMVGTIHSYTTVHRHFGEPPAPFIVAEVQLAAGPLIRAMGASSSPALAIGDGAHGTWQTVRTDDDGNDVVEPVLTGGVA